MFEKNFTFIFRIYFISCVCFFSVSLNTTQILKTRASRLLLFHIQKKTASWETKTKEKITNGHNILQED